MQEKLMTALRAGDFESARLCAEEIGKQAMLTMKSAPNAKARAAIYQTSMTVVGDALHLARVLRAHISTQLNANTGTLLYQQPELEQHRWRIQA